MNELNNQNMDEEEFISIDEEEIDKFAQENPLELETDNQGAQIKDSEMENEIENYEQSKIQPDLEHKEITFQEKIETPKEEIEIQQEEVPVSSPIIQPDENETAQKESLKKEKEQELSTKDLTNSNLKKIEFTKTQKKF